MANYSALKAAVQAVVKTNGNQEITGANMQTTLLSIIDSLGNGYQLMGVATPSTTPPSSPDYNIAYIAGAGSYTNFGTSVVIPPTNIAIFKYNGSWACEQVTVENGGVFDISAYNNNTTYADLAAALGTNGANVPESVRKGGMSVKFVCSSDNKYVQYRLMSDTFNTTVSNWQGVDSTPTSLSGNLIESGGVFDKVGGKIIYGDFTAASGQVTIKRYVINRPSGEKLRISYVTDGGTACDILGLTNGSWFNITHITANQYKDVVLDRDLGEIAIQVANPPSNITCHLEVEFGLDYKLSLLNTSVTNNTNSIETINGSLTDIGNRITSLEKDLIPMSNIGGFSPENLAIFDGIVSEIYVKGVKLETGIIARITYVSWNHSAIKGENYFGVQLFIANNQGTAIEAFNYYIKANSLSSSSLYTLISETSAGKKYDIIIRTAQEYSWPSATAITQTDIQFNKYAGLGYNVLPFLNGLLNTSKHNIKIVSKDGYGDYSKISDASRAEPANTIFIILPGVYDNESINATYTKKQSFIGLDRENTIIKNHYGDYNNPVIVIGAGTIKNLTLYEEKNADSPSSVDMGGYAVHCESNTLHDDVLLIENCTLKSDWHSGIGAGLRGGGKLIIRNCDIITTNGAQGALLCHDNESDSSGYNGEQHLIVENCNLYAPNNQYALWIQSQGKEGKDFTVSQFYLTFLRNRLKGNGSGDVCRFYNYYNTGTVISDDFQGCKNVRLEELSWGNSASVLNAE